MPFLTIFRRTFADALKNSVPTNLANYHRDDKWVSQMGTRTSRELETRVEMKSALSLDEPDDGNLKDYENAIRVHKALQVLTPLQARDPGSTCVRVGLLSVPAIDMYQPTPDPCEEEGCDSN